MILRGEWRKHEPATREGACGTVEMNGRALRSG